MLVCNTGGVKMALVDIDDDLKARVQSYVEQNKVDFPSMKNFMDRAIKKELERIAERKKVEDAKAML